MNFLYFSSSTLPLTLFCLFFIMPGFLVSQSGAQVFEQEYQNCRDAVFKCGNISIGYPFFGGDRVKECGHPELKLLCDHPTNTTTIDILDVNYRVLGIQHDRQILKIWKRDEWTTNDGLCQLPFQDDPDSILDFQVFTPGPNFTNVTLFLDCQSSPTNISSGLRVFPCYYDDYTSSSVTVAIANNTHLEGCSDNLTVSILRTSWEGVRNRSLELERAFPTGFEVRWKEDKEACSNCNASGGACGFGKENQTVCYCPLGSSPDYPNFNKCNHPQPQSPSQSPTGSKSRSKQHLVLIGMPVAAIVLVSAICYVVLRFKRKSLSNHLCPKKMNGHAKIEAFITKFGSIAPRRYPYPGIKKMTNKFNEKLGQGGYGCVYKGKLPDGRLVAVKLLSESKGNGEDFMNEVASISRTSHVNIVTLLGFCFESSKRALVYEFMAQGSLDKFIYDRGSHHHQSHRLEWKTLYDIALGIARGLEYLHQGCNTRILHFDIKPHNILLDENFCPKISDFGLSKLCERKESVISMTGARGTIGYIAPELCCGNFGRVSYKSDIYSYGMMILEMVGGRKNINVEASKTSEVYFPSWIYKHLDESMNLNLNGEIVNDKEEEITRKLIIVSLWCIQSYPSDRPSMTEVLEMFRGDHQSLTIPPKPSVSSPVRSPKTYNIQTSSSMI